MHSNLALISLVLTSILLDKIFAIGTTTPSTMITTENLFKNVSSSENIAAFNETELEKELTVLDVKFLKKLKKRLKINVSIHHSYMFRIIKMFFRMSNLTTL